MGGLLRRDFYWENEQPQSIRLETSDFEMTLPEEYDNNIEITKSEEKIFSDSVDPSHRFSLAENGSYTVHVTLKKPQSQSNGYGQITFSADVTIEVPPPEPKLTLSSNSVVQGDTLSILLENLPEGEVPTAQTDLSRATFMPLEEGDWIAYVGVADSRDPGQYDITVQFKGFKQTLPVTVTQGKFNRQDLWIDTTQPSISEANSPAAYQQYRDTIPAFYETTDLTRYWSGQFLQPVEGRLSSEYGLLRYTNGGSTPRRHAGIDLAAKEGTPIQAPANGRVVFSDKLLNTGNTLVIEHGGGLKSYYFHLSERAVAVDEIVTAGQLLGKVGTTGYSTGAHLHFEIRIGSQNLDPFKFFDGTGGCFTTK